MDAYVHLVLPPGGSSAAALDLLLAWTCLDFDRPSGLQDTSGNDFGSQGGPQPRHVPRLHARLTRLGEPNRARAFAARCHHGFRAKPRFPLVPVMDEFVPWHSRRPITPSTDVGGAGCAAGTSVKA